jgi:hypothetical protein
MYRAKSEFSGKRLILTLVVFVMLFTAAAIPAFALGAADAGLTGGAKLDANMTGSQEAPGPGDPDGTGYARFRLNQGRGLICYALTVSDITLPAVGAHIHKAPVGVAGPIVVPLTPPDASGASAGCVEVDPALIKDIRQNPDQYYVNVHTTDFRPGAVRGQLMNPGQ